ncbi:MAG: radical SAM protein [Candidatus Omnitrophica bacterium]|nr:radical SAM protein [Candidatus Omnitrophota bacterium]MDD5429995.1 radical SAM protein [Candidatus Omnitrophota bacterium]
MKIIPAKTQRVLSATQISLADYVINPYKGCEFGCLYCYAQENKNIARPSFFESLTVKLNAPEILRKELIYKKPKRVLLGSTTECFPCQEKNYRITEQILKILNENNIPYTILTKSHLIAEYLPLIAENPGNKIFFTLNFPTDRLIRLFERKSPNSAKRLQTIQQIIAARIHLRIHIGPFIPYISILEEVLKIIPEGVKEIDIELYHHKMGNFIEMLKQIERNLGRELKNKLAAVYENEKKYLEFAEKIKREIKQNMPKYKANFYYVVPQYQTFYSKEINYGHPLT